MKKWRQKSGCAASFGNTEIKKLLLQIALHRYWNSNLTMLWC
jgi:hypothetical protein